MQKQQLEQQPEQLKKDSAPAGENIPNDPEAGRKENKAKGIKKFLTRRNLIWAGAILVLIGGGAYFWPKIFKPAPKSIHQVAIVVRGQQNPDKAEDARTSLKAGDVLVVVKEGHKWSRIEKASYLILKMLLTEDQAEKLTEPEREKLSRKEKKKEGLDYDPKILRARQYRVKMNKFDFKPLDLLNGQPFQDKIYGWGIVEKKKQIGGRRFWIF